MRRAGTTPIFPVRADAPYAIQSLDVYRLNEEITPGLRVHKFSHYTRLCEFHTRSIPEQ